MGVSGRDPDDRDSERRPADKTEDARSTNRDFVSLKPEGVSRFVEPADDELAESGSVGAEGCFPNQIYRLTGATGTIIREWMIWGSGASNGLLKGVLTWTWKARRSGGKRLRKLA